MLSVSAAEAGRRGNCDCRAKHLPRYAPLRRYALIRSSQCSCCVLFVRPPARLLGRGCRGCVFSPCGSRSVSRSAGQQVLVNIHSQRRRICKSSSLAARQLAHTSTRSPFEPPPPPPPWRGGDVRSPRRCVRFSGNICDLAKLRPSKQANVFSSCGARR